MTIHCHKAPLSSSLIHLHYSWGRGAKKEVTCARLYCSYGSVPATEPQSQASHFYPVLSIDLKHPNLSDYCMNSVLSNLRAFADKLLYLQFHPLPILPLDPLL